MFGLARAEVNFGPLVTARSQPGLAQFPLRKLVPVPFELRRDERQKVTSLLSHAFVALNEKPPLDVIDHVQVLRDGIGQRGVGRMGDRATTAACAGVERIRSESPAPYGRGSLLSMPHRLCAHRPIPHPCANESRTNPEQTFDTQRVSRNYVSRFDNQSCNTHCVSFARVKIRPINGQRMSLCAGRHHCTAVMSRATSLPHTHQVHTLLL